MSSPRNTHAVSSVSSPRNTHAVSVVIPSYQRPGWLRRAVGALAQQNLLPREVVVVLRDTDSPSHEMVNALTQENLPFLVRRSLVSEPGFMPPVAAGIAAAQSDLIMVFDDDAEPEPDCVARLEEHFADPSVGIVGGRCINVDPGGSPLPVDVTSRVGVLTGTGRLEGNLYKKPSFTAAVPVDFVMAGCMAIRSTVAKELEFDLKLNRDVSFGYEIDICRQVANRGFLVLFEPSAAIKHYSAPRAQSGLRSNSSDSIRVATYNEIRILLRRFPLRRSFIAVVRAYLLGTRRAPGIVLIPLWPIGKRLGFQMSQAWPSLLGRVQAARDLALFG